MPTYDGFHQAVLGADLKPLERKDRGKPGLLASAILSVGCRCLRLPAAARAAAAQGQHNDSAAAQASFRCSRG